MSGKCLEGLSLLPSGCLWQISTCSCHSLHQGYTQPKNCLNTLLQKATTNWKHWGKTWWPSKTKQLTFLQSVPFLTLQIYFITHISKLSNLCPSNQVSCNLSITDYFQYSGKNGIFLTKPFKSKVDSILHCSIDSSTISPATQ